MKKTNEIEEIETIKILARKYPNNSEFGYFSRIVLKEKAYGLSPNDYELGELLRNKIKNKKL